MVSVRVLLDSINVLFEGIIWEMKYFSEKYESARLSSAKAKYCCYSAAWLARWNTAWVALNRFSSPKSL